MLNHWTTREFPPKYLFLNAPQHINCGSSSHITPEKNHKTSHCSLLCKIQTVSFGRSFFPGSDESDFTPTGPAGLAFWPWRECMYACSVMSDSLQPHGPGSSVSMEFSRQQYWSGLPFPPPGDLPDPGIKLACPPSPALPVVFLPLHCTTGKFGEVTESCQPQFPHLQMVIMIFCSCRTAEKMAYGEPP